MAKLGMTVTIIAVEILRFACGFALDDIKIYTAATLRLCEEDESPTKQSHGLCRQNNHSVTFTLNVIQREQSDRRISAFFKRWRSLDKLGMTFNIAVEIPLAKLGMTVNVIVGGDPSG